MRKSPWRHVWFGALITARLFEVGKTGLGWYLGREGAASAYEAAGSVVAIFAGWLLLVTPLVGVLTHRLEWSWIKSVLLLRMLASFS